AAGAVSARLLRQGIRRPHRRSQCRLEGARTVDIERRSHAVADRRRQGHETHGRALPASPGSAGEVNAAALTTIAGAAAAPPLFHMIGVGVYPLAVIAGLDPAIHPLQ